MISMYKVSFLNHAKVYELYCNKVTSSDIGYGFIGPEPGWLACRNVGIGRMSEPERIVEEMRVGGLGSDPMVFGGGLTASPARTLSIVGRAFTTQQAS
jgi:phosphopantothenoylcysteine synthetase/decarboxylase